VEEANIDIAWATGTDSAGGSTGTDSAGKCTAGSTCTESVSPRTADDDMQLMATEVDQ
jgi:hypothetical protein